MDTQKARSEFMLLFRGKKWDEGVSLEECQRRIERVMAWLDGLKATGKVKGGQPLSTDNRIVSAKKGKVVADGPFPESKEAIGGYLVVLVNDIEEAVAIATSNPTVEWGITIEVRPVVDECPVFESVQKRLLSEAAVA